MKRVHCTSCGQTFLTYSTEKCDLCRHTGTLVDPESLAAVRDLITRKQEQPENASAVGPALARSAQLALLTYRVARLVIGGLLIIGLGVLLIVSPDLRGPRFTFAAVWPGFAAIGAGLGMIGLSVYLVRSARADVNPPSLQEPPHLDKD